MQLIDLLKSKLVVKNILWNSFDAVVYPLLLLIATPIFVNRLGVELYGVWMFVNTIMASIGVLNAGLGDATIKYVSKYIAKQRTDEIHKIISATYSIYIVLGVIAILVSFVVAFLIRSYTLFDIAKNFSSIAYYSIIITGLTLSFKFVEQIFLSVFRGFDRYDVASKISIIGKLLNVLTNLALVYLNYSLIHILVSTCLISFLFLIVEGFLVNRFSGFNMFYPTFEKKYIREVFSFGIWSWGQSIIGIFSGQVDKFIVLSLSDIKTFAYYSIALTVFSQIHSCFAASVSWLFAVVSKKVYNEEKIQLLYFQSQFYFLTAVIVGLIMFFLLKDSLILWWLGKETYDSTIGFINLFIAYNLLMTLTIIPTYFMNATGHFRLTTLFTFSTLVSRIIFIPLFYYFFNAEGLVIGLIVSGLVITPIQIYIFNNKVLEIRDFFGSLKMIIPVLLFFLIYIRSDVLTSILLMAILIACYAFIFKFSFRNVSIF